jgi:hypothetical protein
MTHCTMNVLHALIYLQVLEYLSPPANSYTLDTTHHLKTQNLTKLQAPSIHPSIQAQNRAYP